MSSNPNEANDVQDAAEAISVALLRIGFAVSWSEGGDLYAHRNETHLRFHVMAKHCPLDNLNDPNNPAYVQGMKDGLKLGANAPKDPPVEDLASLATQDEQALDAAMQRLGSGFGYALKIDEKDDQQPKEDTGNDHA